MKLPFSTSVEPELSLTISTRTFLKVVLLIVVTIALLAALKQAAHSIVLVFVALFLAIALNAPVSWMARHLPGPLRGSRSLATTFSYLIVVIVLGAILINLIPPIIRQTQHFISNAPHLIQDLRSNNSEIGKLIRKYHLQNEVDTFSKQLTTRLQHSTGTAVTALADIGSSIFASVTILVLAFMMLIEGPHWLQVSRQMLPTTRREYVDRLLHDMYKAVKGYVNGQVILAAIAAFIVLPGLLIFHISYPVAMMAIVFICGLIPMVGHTIGIVILGLVALFHSPFAALGIFIYYVLYQQIEAYLIQPRIQANTTNLSPLLVLLSLVVGVSFGGLLGGLVAIPVMACLRVWVIDYLQTQRRYIAAPEPTKNKAE